MKQENHTIKKLYERPAMQVVEQQLQVHLMGLSRSDYRYGGSGYSGSSMGGRYGYDDGGDGFVDSGVDGRSGYGYGGSGFGGSGMSGRSGYGDGGDGFD